MSIKNPTRKEFRHLVFSRKGMICEICGSPYDITLHHIITKANAKRTKRTYLIKDIDNIMVVCEKCHIQIHKESKKKLQKL